MLKRCIQSPWIIVKIRYYFVNLHIDVWLEMVTSTCNSFYKDRVWSRSKPCIQFDIELAIYLLFLTVSPSIISFESLSRVFWNKIFDDHLFLFFKGGMHGYDHYALRWPYDVVENHHNEINHMSRRNLLWADVIILRTKNKSLAIFTSLLLLKLSWTS